ncbi:DUF2264 domain-containing protein [Herbidospora cretacea]|uniref:DUF2264 domain-containing protein n=1 Tax=Herbidospora cretacea TaxID=28444 RepID=UPI0007739AFA|nr:DUF2264 domain-containing protein [Herbidospora cretacea]
MAADRAAMAQLVRDLTDPLLPLFSPGRARLRLGVNTAHYDDAAAELEAFARPLWGLAPLGEGLDPWREGLAAGTDPAHPEYWGDIAEIDQRLVETAALGFALALAPEQLWDGLSGIERDRVVAWLSQALDRAGVDNNWQFFPVMVGLGLRRVGVAFDEKALEPRLDRLESFDLGRGWYSDGPTAQRDYYVPFAMHYYGLIYAGLSEDARAERFRDRAARFALDFRHWFAADGAAVPFGRSMTYRHAQAAFWGATAFAGVDALPWGETKGYLLRHLRWWESREAAGRDGLLTIGYAYPQPLLAEQYNAPGSPYWAMKAFLPLALPEAHPFWTTPETPAPLPDGVVHQPEPGVTLMRSDEGRHVVMLSGAQHNMWARGGAAKYAKFAYSTVFGFSVPAGSHGLEQGAYDSTLALSEDGRHWRCCEVPSAEGDLHLRWSPWDDVEIETWLVPRPPGHLRVHRIVSPRRLFTAEAGFAVDRDTETERDSGAGYAWAASNQGVSRIEDAADPAWPTGVRREGEVVQPHPGTNVLVPRTILPTLRGEHAPGEFWLTCLVTGRLAR